MMKRRFGRGRKANAGKSKSAPIDAARCFERIAAEKIVAAKSLSPITSDEIPEHFAAVAVGESERGGRLVVAFAPRNGGDAALAGLAYAKSLAADGGFDGEVIAVCPQWSIEARQRLGILAPQGFGFRAVAASSLADGDGSVDVPPGDVASRVPARWVADRVEGAARDLFLRALAALEGLAAKHGGAVRGVGSSVELVLLARRVASIRVETLSASERPLLLETIQPEKATERLDSGNLAVAMDRLEGSLRKRLNDRRARGSEEGLRAQLVGPLIEAEGIRESALWPLAGSEPEVVDLVGVGAAGAAVVGALRSKISLPELAAILDGVTAVRPALAAWLAGADAPVRLDAVRPTQNSGCANQVWPPRWPSEIQRPRSRIDRKPQRTKRPGKDSAPPPAAADADSAVARLVNRGKAVNRPSLAEIATTKFRSSTWMTARIRIRAGGPPGVDGAETVAAGPRGVMTRRVARNPNPHRMLQALPSRIRRAVRVRRAGAGAAAAASTAPVPRRIATNSRRTTRTRIWPTC
jgi:hypothetical protein